MVIRKATEADINAISTMGEHFLAYSPFSAVAHFDRESVARLICHFINDENSEVFVIDNGVVVGGILGSIVPLWFNSSVLMASEMAWWVEPEYRGIESIKLLKRFEEWGRSKGAAIVSLSDLVVSGEKPLELLVKRLGYMMVERSHIKEI